MGVEHAILFYGHFWLTKTSSYSLSSSSFFTLGRIPECELFTWNAGVVKSDIIIYANNVLCRDDA